MQLSTFNGRHCIPLAPRWCAHPHEAHTTASSSTLQTMPVVYPTAKSPPPNEAAMSKIAPSPPPAAGISTNGASHQVGTRQATRSRTRTRQVQQPANGNMGAGPSRTSGSLPRYNSEDHPLSPHKLAARGYHSFQCLGIPFHVKRRYTFLRELGIGAYGCVALARDDLLDCNVA